MLGRAARPPSGNSSKPKNCRCPILQALLLAKREQMKRARFCRGRTLGALHLTPLVTGHDVWKLRRSSSPLGLMLWNSSALPLRGLTAR
jgi:hypothetical protein